MALTLPEALKRSQNPMFAAIAKAVITTDALGAVIPFSPASATSVPVAREGTLPTGGAFLPDSGATSEESTGTDDVVHVPLRRVVGDVRVDSFADKMASPAGGSHTASQLTKKVKATWRTVTNKLINGANVTGHTLFQTADPFAAIDAIDYGPWLSSARRGPGSIKYTHAGTLWQFRAPGDVEYGTAVACAADGTYTLRSWNESSFIRVTLDVSDATTNGETSIVFTSSANEFDGLIELCDPGQLIDPVGANGDAFSISLLDEMIRYLKHRENPAFIMNSAMIDRYLALLRAMGGTTPPMMAIEGYQGGGVPTYRNIPILPDDWISVTDTVGSATNCSSLYLAALDESEGLSMAAATNTQGLAVDGDPRRNIVLGWEVESLGVHASYDAKTTRVKFYGAPILRSKLALVRKRGVLSS